MLQDASEGLAQRQDAAGHLFDKKFYRVVVCKKITQIFHILLTLSRLSPLIDAGAILTRTGSKKNAFADKIANHCPAGNHFSGCHSEESREWRDDEESYG